MVREIILAFLERIMIQKMEHVGEIICHVTDLAQAHIFSSEISDQWWRKQYFQSWKWSWIHSERSY